MVSIKVNGNRSDICGYLSYYSNDQVAELLGCKEDEITYESNVNDYFYKGDLREDVFLEISITMPKAYEIHIHELTSIIVKHVGIFTNKCRVYFTLIEPENIFVYDATLIKK